eukprot:8632029-Ditylum_brightwellii.AAC.1
MGVFTSAYGYANAKSIALVCRLYSIDMIIIVVTAGHDTIGVELMISTVVTKKPVLLLISRSFSLGLFLNLAVSMLIKSCFGNFLSFSVESSCSVL